jgi:hypothetical protein
MSCGTACFLSNVTDKYMHEKISERSGGKYSLLRGRKLAKLTPQIALDDRIDELADLVRQHYGLAELGDPSASTDVGHFVQCHRYLYQTLLGSSCCCRSYYP